MIANNENLWSALINGEFHTWTTGKDYVFSIGDESLTFGSDNADSTVIPLAMAQDFSQMFGDLFGATFE